MLHKICCLVVYFGSSHYHTHASVDFPEMQPLVGRRSSASSPIPSSTSPETTSRALPLTAVSTISSSNLSLSSVTASAVSTTTAATLAESRTSCLAECVQIAMSFVCPADSSTVAAQVVEEARLLVSTLGFLLAAVDTIGRRGHRTVPVRNDSCRMRRIFRLTKLHRLCWWRVRLGASSPLLPVLLQRLVSSRKVKFGVWDFRLGVMLPRPARLSRVHRQVGQ